MKRIFIFIAVFALLGIKANAQKGNFFAEGMYLNSNNLIINYEGWSQFPTQERRLVNINNNFTVALGHKYLITDKFGITTKISSPIKFNFDDEWYSSNDKKFYKSAEHYTVTYIPISIGVCYNFFENFKTEVDYTYGINTSEKRYFNIKNSWSNKPLSFSKYSLKAVYVEKKYELFAGLELLSFAYTNEYSRFTFNTNINSISFGCRYNFLNKRKENQSMIVF